MAQPIIIGKKYLFSTFTDTKKHIVMHVKRRMRIRSHKILYDTSYIYTGNRYRFHNG